MSHPSEAELDAFFDDYLSKEDPPGWSNAELDHPHGQAIYEPDGETVLPQRFRIETDMTAAWAMRKLRAVTLRRDHNSEIATKQIADIQRWEREANARHERDITFFTALLKEYALDCRYNPDDGRKTISVPGGKVQTRSGTLRWKIDNETFIAWARSSHPDLIRVKEEPALTEVKATLNVENETVFTDTGEIVPGIEVEQGEPTATVTVD